MDYRSMDKQEKIRWPQEIGVLVLRLLVSLMLIHHGLQKLYNPAAFTANIVVKYFPFLPHPLAWTWCAIVVELLGPLLIALGVLTRLMSFLLLCAMVVANAFHFLATGFEDFPIGVPAGGAYLFEPSLLCFAIFFYFLCNGPGKLALKPNLL